MYCIATVYDNYSRSVVFVLVFQLSDVKDGVSQAVPAFGFGSKQAGSFGSPGKRVWLRKVGCYRLQL